MQSCHLTCHRRCHPWVAALALVTLFGCDNGTVCGAPGGCVAAPDGSVGPIDMEIDAERDADPDMTADPPTCDMGPPVEPGAVEPFVATVQSRLYAECQACHNAPTPDPDDRVFKLITGGPGGLDEAQQTLNAHEALSFMDLADPSQSALVMQHTLDGLGPPTSDGLSAALVTWVAPPAPSASPEACDPVDMAVDPPTGDGIACDALPGPDSELGYSDRYWQTYAEGTAAEPSIDETLVTDCATAGCHVSDGAGEGYWLMTEGDTCATRWNFLATQWFVRPADIARSPLLLKPIEEMHGGREVYRGRDDLRFVRLQRWLEAEFTR